MTGGLAPLIAMPAYISDESAQSIGQVVGWVVVVSFAVFMVWWTNRKKRR